MNALAALALARAGLIGAGAGLHILLDVTFHYGPPGLMSNDKAQIGVFAILISFVI